MKRIGIFTSGGDAPGMNACIRAAVRAGVHYGIDMYGIYRGYEGMIEGDIHLLDSSSVANIIHLGGTILKSARSEEFRTPEGRKKAYENLKKKKIDGIVCIGGNGTYTGALTFEKEYGIPSVGCPGTIDNDLFGTDYTIGFDTAVNTAMEAVDKIRDTADAHNRVFFVEVMGRHSGYIALHSGIAGGAEGIMIPEKLGEFENVINNWKEKSRKKSFSIFLIAEGDEEGEVMQVAQRFKAAHPEAEVRVSILGHIQRGGSPTASDRVLASRLGAHAVKALLDGQKNVAVGVINGEIAFTPFDDAINKVKSIGENLWMMNKVISK